MLFIELYIQYRNYMLIRDELIGYYLHFDLCHDCFVPVVQVVRYEKKAVHWADLMYTRTEKYVRYFLLFTAFAYDNKYELPF